MSSYDDYYQSKESFEPIRTSVDVNVGALVACHNETFRIKEILDYDSVIGVNLNTGLSQPLRVGELRSVKAEANDLPIYDIDDIDAKDWKVAEERYQAIEPLLHLATPGRKRIEDRAEEIGIHPATLYRWLKQYKGVEVRTALIPQRRGWKKGKGRISIEAEKVISETINDFYLTSQRPSAQETINEVNRRCYTLGIKAPGPSAIRARIARIPERLQLRGRGKVEEAKNKYKPCPGNFPNADYPLAVVQIDHTPGDIILVDDKYRRPIGRPYFTVAIDVYSRMVTGYHISLEAPSVTTVAISTARSMLPKEDILALHGINSKWPVWGKPRTIHVDNGPEFQSESFQNSCKMYGIHLNYRPKKAPEYGGHVERLIKTFMKEIHKLPGTTFSSVAEKGEYDSLKHASFTLAELERWFVKFICNIYHQRKHYEIGIPPIRKWEIGIKGDGEVQGIGYPPRPEDHRTLLLDFLPAFKRTVQPFGVTIDSLRYYAEPLRPWINASDPDDLTRKRKLIFRRDPRDISSIWFFDPELGKYFKIPFANMSLPPMSKWEHDQIQKKLKNEARKINEHSIIEAQIELRQIVQDSMEKTRKARRQAQRSKENLKHAGTAMPFKKKTVKEPAKSNTGSFVSGDLDDFGDIA